MFTIFSVEQRMQRRVVASTIHTFRKALTGQYSSGTTCCRHHRLLTDSIRRLPTTQLLSAYEPYLSANSFYTSSRSLRRSHRGELVLFILDSASLLSNCLNDFCNQHLTFIDNLVVAAKEIYNLYFFFY